VLSINNIKNIWLLLRINTKLLKSYYLTSSVLDFPLRVPIAFTAPAAVGSGHVRTAAQDCKDNAAGRNINQDFRSPNHKCF